MIDAAHILSLIGSKVSAVNGIQTIDQETLRIIYEQIQELSNMGDDEQAQLLKEFVDSELVPGNLSSGVNFDESFELWKKGKQMEEVEVFAKEWGLDGKLLLSSIIAYTASQPDVVPYIDGIMQSLDFGNAEKKSAGNRLKHVMKLSRVLPGWMAEMKQKFI